METYYYQDPGIQEHIDQIVEKLFAVCLLTGPDADAEFQRGLKSAHKLVVALASLSSLSEGEIYNGLRQIIEQRLPDPRVIENFPMFNTTLEKLIIESVAIASSSPVVSGSRVHIIDDRSGSKTDPSQIKVKAYENRYPNSVQVSANSVTEIGLPQPLELSQTDAKPQMELELGPKPEPEREPEPKPEPEPEREPVPEPETKPEPEPETKLEPEPERMGQNDSKPIQGGVRRPITVPPEAEHLALVLSYLFPKASVRWNMNLAGYHFLAQVGDILIYLEHIANGSEVEQKMRAEGWKTVVINYDDLRYWRRLERHIRKTAERKNNKVRMV